MLSPEIKSYFCTDIDNIETWFPHDPEYVSFWIDVIIGLKGSDAGDNFQVHVVTQKQLSQIENKEYLLIIPYFENIEKVIELLNKTIKECKGINWAGVSIDLSKKYLWDYHDFPNKTNLI